jgi:hypothetical protein
VLARHHEPTAWREFTGRDGRRVTLKPDAFFAIGSKSRCANWFVEVDRGTVGGSTLDRKLSTYVDASRSGQALAARGTAVKVLWLVPDRHRLDRLQQAFGRTPAAARGLFRAAIFDDLIAVLANEEVLARGKHQLARAPARIPESDLLTHRQAV